MTDYHSSSIIRVVVDVNLLIRGTISPRGGSGLLIQALKQRRFLSITSRPHLEELYRVLGYRRLVRKYRITQQQRQRLVAQLYQRSVWVEPLGNLTLCRDPKDDYLLEMVLLGQATHLISEDKDFYDDPNLIMFLNQRGVNLVRLGEFFSILRSVS